SKSLGNFFTLRDVKAEYNLEILRFFLLSAHYRSPVNFSREVMDQMKSGLERIYTSKYALEDLLETTEDRELDSADEEVIKSLDERKLGFEKAMDDDMNTADAISEIFNIVKIANSNIDENSNKKVVEYALNMLNSLNTVLGIGGKSRETITDEDIIALIEERNNARKNKDFARADEIRDELTAKGIVLEDTREGVKFRRV
ncbi:MAG: cysteine--tRNA ligase, partial [Tissierellia bacterium]|nr:cysteine--tRNA ligase [Tissierellia bacterium]